MGSDRSAGRVRFWAGLAAVVLCSGAAPGADDFSDVIRAVSTTRPDATTQVLSGQIYAATITGTIADSDGDNTNYADGDAMNVTLSNRHGGSITTPADLTADRFEQWVRDNATEIVDILFPSGVGTSVSGVDDAQGIALSFFSTYVAPTASPRDHAASSGVADQLVPLREVSALIEVEEFEVDGFDGTSVNFSPGYNFSVGHAEFGFSIPMRYSFLDDEIDTDSYSLGAEIHASYPVVRGKSWAVFLLGGGFFNSLLFTSDAIEVAGFLRYGGVAGVSGRAVVRPFLLSGGVLYTASEFDIPSSRSSEEIDQIIDALEDRPLDQQLTFGGNIGLPLSIKYVLNLRVLRTETVGPSDIVEGKQAFTTGTLSFAAYFSAQFALDVGYRRLFGAEDLESQSVHLLGRYNF